MDPKRRWYELQDRLERSILERDDSSITRALRDAESLRAAEPAWADYVDWLLFVAAEYGHLHTLKELIRMGANVDNPNTDSGPALSAAARQGRIDAVAFLLEAGASLEVIPARREGLPVPFTPLMEAIATERVSLRKLIPRQIRSEMVRMLVDAGADVNAAVPDWTDVDFLGEERAEDASGDYRFVRRVLVADRGEVLVGYDHAIVPLSQTSEPVIVESLLAAGAQPDLDARGLPLFRAITEGSLGTVRMLLEHGATTSGLSPRGRRSALLEAIRSDNVAMVDALLSSGAELHGGEDVRPYDLSSAMRTLMLDHGYFKE